MRILTDWPTQSPCASDSCWGGSQWVPPTSHKVRTHAFPQTHNNSETKASGVNRPRIFKPANAEETPQARAERSIQDESTRTKSRTKQFRANERTQPTHEKDSRELPNQDQPSRTSATICRSAPNVVSSKCAVCLAGVQCVYDTSLRS